MKTADYKWFFIFGKFVGFSCDVSYVAVHFALLCPRFSSMALSLSGRICLPCECVTCMSTTPSLSFLSVSLSLSLEMDNKIGIIKQRCMHILYTIEWYLVCGRTDDCVTFVSIINVFAYTIYPHGNIIIVNVCLVGSFFSCYCCCCRQKVNLPMIFYVAEI